MKTKGMIGCDEDKEFVVYELENGVFATVGKNGNIQFSAEWLHHAKWVPFDSSGVVPEDLHKLTKEFLVRYSPTDKDKKMIEDAKHAQSIKKYKEIAEWQKGHIKECRKRHQALMI